MEIRVINWLSKIIKAADKMGIEKIKIKKNQGRVKIVGYAPAMTHMIEADVGDIEGESGEVILKVGMAKRFMKGVEVVKVKDGEIIFDKGDGRKFKARVDSEEEFDEKELKLNEDEMQKFKVDGSDMYDFLDAVKDRDLAIKTGEGRVVFSYGEENVWKGMMIVDDKNITKKEEVYVRGDLVKDYLSVFKGEVEFKVKEDYPVVIEVLYLDGYIRTIIAPKVYE